MLPFGFQWRPLAVSDVYATGTGKLISLWYVDFANVEEYLLSLFLNTSMDIRDCF